MSANQPRLFSRPRRFMRQPRKRALRDALRDAADTIIRERESLQRAQAEAEGLRAARRHDHDRARRVPRWVRRIFRA